MSTTVYVPDELRRAYADAPIVTDYRTPRRVVNGTAYHLDTPVDLVATIEHARINRFRIRVDYGDTTTGESWGDVHDVTGYIGRSTGEIKIPLLVPTARSTGGGGLLDHAILTLAHSNKRYGGTLYRAEPRVPTDWPVQPLPYRIPDVYDEDLGRYTVRVALCNACHRYWNDAETTSMTPTPAGRCPFEPFHTF